MKNLFYLVVMACLISSCAAGLVIGTNNKQSQEVQGNASVDSVSRPSIVIN